MPHTPTRPRTFGIADSLRRFGAARSTALVLTAMLLTAAEAHSQSLGVSSPRELLTADPDSFAALLDAARPMRVSAEEKGRILAGLPQEGEVLNLGAGARQKLAALIPLLQAADRDSVYEIKVVNVPQAAIGLHARAIVLISEAALALLNTRELQAAVAHEIGHEYVWLEYERAKTLGDHQQVQQLELMCDAIAIVVLQRVGVGASELMSGVEKISRFNRERLGIALNEKDYPTVVQRKQSARVIEAWVMHRTAKPDSGRAPQN
jgi:hypothetical protein